EAVRAEQVGDHFGQLLYVVAQPPRAELSEVSEVFAELGRFHAGGRRQRVAGNGADGIRFQSMETTEVNGQAVNRFARNFWTAGSFYCAGKLSNEGDAKQESGGKSSVDTPLIHEHQFVREQQDLGEFLPRVQRPGN